jgi:hypothetical protein
MKSSDRKSDLYVVTDIKKNMENIVDLSDQGIIASYKGIIKGDSESTGDFEKYIDNYYEIRELIEKGGKDVSKRTALLDEAFEETISDMAEQSSNEVSRFLELHTTNADVSFSRAEYEKVFKQIGMNLKNLNPPDSDDINEEINKIIAGNKVGSYEDIRFLADIGAAAWEFMEDVKEITDTIVDADELELAYLGDSYEKMMAELDGFAKTLDTFDRLYNELDKSGLSGRLINIITNGSYQLHDLKESVDELILDYRYRLDSFIEENKHLNREKSRHEILKEGLEKVREKGHTTALHQNRLLELKDSIAEREKQLVGSRREIAEFKEGLRNSNLKQFDDYLESIGR